MQKLTAFEAFALLCKSTNKWGLYISFNWPLDEEGKSDFDLFEISKAAPYIDLTIENKTPDMQMVFDEQGFILCDSEEEMQSLYDQTVGDDGPTKLNSYDGPARVFALTCDPNGNLLGENT